MLEKCILKNLHWNIFIGLAPGFTLLDSYKCCTLGSLKGMQGLSINCGFLSE